MGMRAALVLYTHSDYSDVSTIFFEELKKYMPDFNGNIYLICDKDYDKSLHDSFNIKYLIYNNDDSYVERLISTISKITDEVILFLHEDMMLYDYPKIDMINKYISYVEAGYVDSIKLIYVEGTDTLFDLNSTLVRNRYSKFSVQPTLIKPSTLLSLLEDIGNKNIWEFEVAVPLRNDYMVRLGSEEKRGNYHYNSIVFPYIATAINKGRWNLKEYSLELNNIFDKYNVDSSKRGII